MPACRAIKRSSNPAGKIDHFLELSVLDAVRATYAFHSRLLPLSLYFLIVQSAVRAKFTKELLTADEKGSGCWHLRSTHYQKTVNNVLTTSSGWRCVSVFMKIRFR